MKATLISGSIAAALLMGAGVQPASAALDAKTYPASMCSARSTPDYAPGGNGQLNNIGSSQPLQVTCPVVRDNMTAQTSAVQAFVKVINPNVQFRTSCSLRSMREDGTLFSSFTGTLKQASSAVQTIELFNVNSALNGSYTIFCTIPALSAAGLNSIQLYRVEEKQ